MSGHRQGGHARRWVALVVAAAAAFTPASCAVAAVPPVGHVFVVVLENQDYASTFGADSDAPYLAHELTASGQLLTHYYGIGHASLDNYIAMVSGQAPNAQTQSDCQVFEPFAGLPGPDADGQAVGQGCVYPGWVDTVAGQLTAKGLSWKGYMEDMGTPCRHPEIGARDDTQQARAGDQYATRHNPFVYFHSIIDSPDCQSHDVPLHRLPDDLERADTTANLSFITPNLCNDGHDAPCVDGRPGGLVSADAWLKTWIPRITASPAFAKDGVLVVTFDEAEDDASACCGEPSGPNTANPGGSTAGNGGGRVGAVVISPFTRAGTVNPTPYNHYALLRTIEDLFGLAHLGYAGQAGLRPFGEDVFADAPAPVAPTVAPGPTAPGPAAAAVAAVAGPATTSCRDPFVLAQVRGGRRLRVRFRLRAGATALVMISYRGRRMATFSGRRHGLAWRPRRLGRGLYLVKLRSGPSRWRFAARQRRGRFHVLGSRRACVGWRPGA